MSDVKPSTTRKQALKVARMIGSYGAHQDESGKWMPCSSPAALAAVLKNNPEPAKKQESITAIETKMARRGSMSENTFDTHAEAMAEAKRRQCNGVRIIKIGGVTKYAVCNTGGIVQPVHLIGSRKPIWDNLLERPISGITTLPAGGMVSTPPPGDFAGGGMKMEDVELIDAKAFVQYVSRSTDPNVYLDADSAREHSRMIGCIGIRSYTARDGKTVYLPCSNVSDYNRVLGLNPSGTPKPPKKKDDFEDAEEKTAKHGAKTPAPKKDKIIGSSKNRIGSARSARAAIDITLTPEIMRALAVKVREHNLEIKDKKKADWAKTNLGALKAVYRRGAGAFSVSHRPDVTRGQWAMGRVNAFLNLLSTGSAKASYTTDNDLLPKGHPWKAKGIGSKSMFIGDIEVVGEHIGSFKTSSKGVVLNAKRFVATSAFLKDKESE